MPGNHTLWRLCGSAQTGGGDEAAGLVVGSLLELGRGSLPSIVGSGVIVYAVGAKASPPAGTGWPPAAAGISRWPSDLTNLDELAEVVNLWNSLSAD
jgi:hypothetical protein